MKDEFDLVIETDIVNKTGSGEYLCFQLASSSRLRIIHHHAEQTFIHARNIRDAHHVPKRDPVRENFKRISRWYVDGFHRHFGLSLGEPVHRNGHLYRIGRKTEAVTVLRKTEFYRYRSFEIVQYHVICRHVIQLPDHFPCTGNQDLRVIYPYAVRQSKLLCKTEVEVQLHRHQPRGSGSEIKEQGVRDHFGHRIIIAELRSHLQRNIRS